MMIRLLSLQNVYKGTKLALARSSSLSSSSAFKYAGIKEAILEDSLLYVEAHGWTTQSLSLAAIKNDLPGLGHGVITRGPVEMVEYYLKNKNKFVINEFNNHYRINNDNCEIGDNDDDNNNNNISFQSEERLKFILNSHIKYLVLSPYMINKWPQATALLLEPSNLFSSLLILLETIDNIQKLMNKDGKNDDEDGFDGGISSNSGSGSGNNRYIDTILLVGAYTAVELHLLGKGSTSISDTGNNNSKSSETTATDTDNNNTDEIEIKSETSEFIDTIVQCYMIAKQKLFRL